MERECKANKTAGNQKVTHNHSSVQMFTRLHTRSSLAKLLQACEQHYRFEGSKDVNECHHYYTQRAKRTITWNHDGRGHNEADAATATTPAVPQTI